MLGIWCPLDRVQYRMAAGGCGLQRRETDALGSTDSEAPRGALHLGSLRHGPGVRGRAWQQCGDLREQRTRTPPANGGGTSSRIALRACRTRPDRSATEYGGWEGGGSDPAFNRFAVCGCHPLIAALNREGGGAVAPVHLVHLGRLRLACSRTAPSQVILTLAVCRTLGRCLVRIRP